MRAWILAATLLLGSCATDSPTVVASRADGEGHAARGELVLRLKVYSPSAAGYFAWASGREERATIEIRYAGMDDAGRALFDRHDLDRAAVEPGTATGGADHRLTVDLRTTRQIRLQGKIIEILEADPSGVVFRLH